jgi:hypothetical protein
MLRIISEQTLNIDNYDVLHRRAEGIWPRKVGKIKEILSETGIDWCERRFISKMYMDLGVKVQLDQGESRSVKIGRGLGAVCHKFYSTYTASTLPREPL